MSSTVAIRIKYRQGRRPSLDFMRRSMVSMACHEDRERISCDDGRLCSTLGLFAVGAPRARRRKASRRLMGADLSLFKKGLILIAIPLILQWAFIGLSLHIREEGQEDHRELSRSKEVVAEAGHIQRLLLEAHNDMRGFVITGDPGFAQAYEEAVRILPQKIAALQRPVRDPGQRLRITRIAGDATALLGFLGELNGFMQAGKLEQAVAAVKALTGQQRMNDLRREMNIFLQRARELDRARDLAAEERWRREDWWLGTGAAASLLLGLGLTYAFSRGISRRLNALVQNAQRLAEGEAPLSALGGEDEIGRVDQAFHTMASTLRRRTTDLNASNRELQDFAAVASHDLQEPLRKIEAFGSRLRTKYDQALDEQGRDYLARMLAAAVRMRRLINDLLSFSRVTTKARAFVTVALAEVAQQVVSDLEGRMFDTGGRVEVGALPTIEAEPLQMRQLLQNLIGNGLKFHREGEPPVVRISGRLLDTSDPAEGPAPGPRHCEIRVQDNGIGFEEVYSERIFELFQRLHGRDEYEGTGMGLAICRKIVTRHGGTISAHSAPGHGATFLVTLAVTQEENPA
ncbi:MAG: sensor histidine kinase [Gammaproteobacteria bacterium]